ncbi:MAG: 30S ribosomal protein S5 [Candidatus Aenigmatarchaeota archaeon]
MVYELKARTELGKKVLAGEITSIEQIFSTGQKIREPWIVDKLLPNLKSEVLFFGGSPGKGGGITRTSTRRTARMHRSGRRYKISALVAVGSLGYVGLGKATSNEHSIAISKATDAAKLNIIPIKLGCGSWECRCKQGHSIPVVASGKRGSVFIKLFPAPTGVGLCIADEGKKIVRLAGIRDIWSQTEGQSRTRYNYAWALYDALKSMNRMKLDLPDVKAPVELAGEEKREKDETAELEAKELEEIAAELAEKPKKEDVIARPELEGGVEVEE